MTDKAPAPATIAAWMAEHDRVARHFGVRVEEARAGYCRCALTVREDMLNAVGITQGGVTFTLADFAFAVASNSHGRTAVALSATIQFPASSRVGDILTAEAVEESRSRRTGIYNIRVTRGDGTPVALFTGTVFVRDDAVSDWVKPNEDRS